MMSDSVMMCLVLKKISVVFCKCVVYNIIHSTKGVKLIMLTKREKNRIYKIIEMYRSHRPHFVRDIRKVRNALGKIVDSKTTNEIITRYHL